MFISTGINYEYNQNKTIYIILKYLLIKQKSKYELRNNVRKKK